MYYLVYDHTKENFYILKEKKYIKSKNNLELIDFDKNINYLCNKLELIEQQQK